MASLYTVSGVIAILAGILNVFSGLPNIFPEPRLSLIRRAADICALIALLGIYLYQREQLGIIGHAGFVISVLAILMLIASFQYETAIGIYALGLLAFGVATLLAGVFPVWAAWMWIAAPLIGIPSVIFPTLGEILPQIAAIFFALGFGGFGVHLLRAGF